MEVLLEEREGVLVARVSGELDAQNAAEFRQKLEHGLLKSGALNLVLDLARVSFIDSSGLGVILGRYKELKPRGGKVLIAEARPKVLRILELSGLFKLVEVCSSVEVAEEKAAGRAY